MYEELITKLRTESLDSRKATLPIMDLCMDAAVAIETMSASLAAARAGRDAAVADLSSALGDIESIRQRYGIDNADADDALSCICESYCISAGRMCYKEGNRCQCENFRWRGATEGGKAE